MTQCLTGHVCFMGYLKRFGRRASSKCMFCEDDDDNVRHTLFICRQFRNRWEQLNEDVEATISQNHLVDLMIDNERKWEAVEFYINYIMGQKDVEERRRQTI